MATTAEEAKLEKAREEELRRYQYDADQNLDAGFRAGKLVLMDISGIVRLYQTQRFNKKQSITFFISAEGKMEENPLVHVKYSAEIFYYTYNLIDKKLPARYQTVFNTEEIIVSDEGTKKVKFTNKLYDGWSLQDKYKQARWSRHPKVQQQGQRGQLHQV